MRKRYLDIDLISEELYSLLIKECKEQLFQNELVSINNISISFEVENN